MFLSFIDKCFIVALICAQLIALFMILLYTIPDALQIPEGKRNLVPFIILLLPLVIYSGYLGFHSYVKSEMNQFIDLNDNYSEDLSVFDRMVTIFEENSNNDVLTICNSLKKEALQDNLNVEDINDLNNPDVGDFGFYNEGGPQYLTHFEEGYGAVGYLYWLDKNNNISDEAIYFVVFKTNEPGLLIQEFRENKIIEKNTKISEVNFIVKGDKTLLLISTKKSEDKSRPDINMISLDKR